MARTALTVIAVCVVFGQAAMFFMGGSGGFSDTGSVIGSRGWGRWKDAPPAPAAGPRPNPNPDLRLPTPHATAIPPNLWTFWHTHPPPPFIQLCLRTWAQHHPNHTITLLTPSTYRAYLAPTTIPPPHLGALLPQHMADWVRLAVLRDRGGTWLDASIIATAPLDATLELARRNGRDSLMFWMRNFTWEGAGDVPASVAGGGPLGTAPLWIEEVVAAKTGMPPVDGEIAVATALNTTADATNDDGWVARLRRRPRHPVLDNWFISSVAGGEFVSRWLDEFDTAVRRFNLTDAYLEHLADTATSFKRPAFARRLPVPPRFPKPLPYILLLQNIPNPSYLKATVALQRVMRWSTPPPPIPHPLPAETHGGPFQALADVKWDDEVLARRLAAEPWVDLPRPPVLVKLRGKSRAALARLWEEGKVVRGSFFEKYLGGEEGWAEGEWRKRVVGLDDDDGENKDAAAGAAADVVVDWKQFGE
ncbi:hypothetical protein HDU96_000107 [Phlyctochytrium bullatum]|nr:hypothetical protein HDU96_000107 [Phlyctochytrium bullatum]